MSRKFRAQFVLMLFGRYDFGDHVSDPEAFSIRIHNMLSRKRGDHYLQELL